jgi:Xaa-Pro aminopeptidase
MSRSIAPERYATRLERAQAVVAERQVGALLIGPGADLRWLIGYEAMPLERLTMLVLPATGRATLVVPRLEAAAARSASGVEHGVVDLASWEETDDPVDLVARQDGLESAADGAAQVLVSDRLAAAFLLPIQTRLPAATFGLASAVLSDLRAVKDEEEIGLLRRAAQAADRTVAAICAGRLVGRTEADVAREVRERLVAEGHDEAAFWIVASGPNSASPHHGAADRVISAGEPIVLDIGGRIEGYGSDITRTLWPTGGDEARGPDVEYRTLFSTLERAQAAASAAAVVGASGEDVDMAARSIIAEAGFGDAFIHRTGHGIGLEGHEEPYLVSGNKEPLVAGNCFSTEPGLYLEGRYGARIEDIVVCRAEGPDILNGAPRSLAVVSGV